MNQLIPNLFGGKRRRLRRGNRTNQTRAQRTNAQRPIQGHTYATIPKIRFAPLMPKEFSVALVDREVITYTAATGTVKQTFGMLEYLNRRPLYLNQFYAMYKYSRVTAVQYHYEVVNFSDAIFDFMFGVVPYSDVLALSATQLGERPGTVRRLVSAKGGLDRATLNKTACPETWFGNPYQTKDYWVNESQSSSLTPLDTDEPVGVLLMEPRAGSVTAQVTVRTTYHIQFFDLETPGLSAFPVLKQDKIRSESFESVSIKRSHV